MNVPAGTYRIKRGPQEFGPYDGGTLQRYIESGNIVMSDFVEANSSGMWIPLPQLLSSQGSLNTGSGYPPPLTPQPMSYLSGPAPIAGGVDLPPNLHWALLLLLGIIPFFSVIWGLILAAWAKRLNGNAGPLIAMSISGAALLGYWVSLLNDAPGGVALCGLVCFISLLVAMFSIRSSMEEYYNSKENIGLSLSGVMTFFFNLIYFQYHVNRIARWKRTGILD
jgi:hypothetical protein